MRWRRARVRLAGRIAAAARAVRGSRRLAFCATCLIALACAALLIRARYQAEVAGESVRVHARLEAAAAALAAELERGQRAALGDRGSGDAADWHRWSLGSAAGGDELPLSEPTLRRAIARSRATAAASRLLGPFGTDRSRDVFVLLDEPLDAGAPPSGAWVYADVIASRAHLGDISGYRVQLYDPASAAALYQTDPGTLDSPIALPLRVAGTALELRAAPRDAAGVPARALAPALLVAAAVLVWLSSESRRGQARRNLVERLEEAERRRRAVNAAYGAALESVAALESRLHMASMYDTVTGLANRSSLIRRIESILAAMRQSSSGAVSVMAVGFDHIHHITNSFGAEFASRVLVIAAERVEHVLPSKDLLFRTGEFNLAVVLPQSDSAGSVALAQKVVLEIEAPIALEGRTFMLHPSLGIAEASSGYEYPETLLDRANTALGAVARDAPIRYCLFDSATARESVSRLQLEVDLDRAFMENQLVLEYEPFVRPVTYAVAGFEALIRWNHPTEGLLPPARFVPIAVEAGMSHRLNDWVIRQAARQAALWYRAGHRDFFVNFNLSAEAFLRPNLAEEIGDVLAEFELPGEYLIVELTESTLIQDTRAASRTLQRLSELGVLAWLDDFGTGYSSLSHLRALPLRGVKIDRSFIERIVIDARDAGFIKALIDLIGYLGLQSIAEGIESKDQYELLSLTACDLYQGHHFSRSLPAARAERWLASDERSVRRSGTS
jgi:diguanylate cyclase (GGDEF)-like protein